ncbi:hypothetical protein [Methylomonas koyamae]|uniref:hypothetical protein n=1 Tax=Methylomonas koyamae TaxID=702114 RepID=UPI000BC2E887|nr:hypothetical protein [Methylomonas koyamae]ATG89293.1 hypothetical protein MKLM6_1030 [Methylomonas koyamae]
METIHPGNLGLALGLINAFAAEHVDMSAGGIQQVLTAKQLPSDLDAIRLVRPAGMLLGPAKINALLAHLTAVPFEVRAVS